MLTLLFTLDYEVHGNGDGRPHELMIEPTARMLRQFDEFGAKLTIMADVAEILRFKEHRDQTGRDEFHYEAVAQQLRDAIRTGHDVQLHIHSGYFNARYHPGGWIQDWSEYNFAGLKYERMEWMIRTGKEYLETLLRPVNPLYRCTVFRAANWSVSPSTNVVRALLANGIEIDTSVFKYGRRTGLVAFDYSHAPSEVVPWRVAEDDMCRASDSGKLFEVPIYTERRWIGAFLSLNRFYRVALGRQHQVVRPESPEEPAAKGPNAGRLGRWRALAASLFQRHAWKADFNQCTGRQLIGAVDRCRRRHGGNGVKLPFVLIGHSKLYTPANERSLRPLLAHVRGQGAELRFGTFADCGLETLRTVPPGATAPA